MTAAPRDAERPVDPGEIPVLGFWHRRSSINEEMQIETKALNRYFLRSNTSMQLLVPPTQAKTAFLYGSKYCSNDPSELSSTHFTILRYRCGRMDQLFLLPELHHVMLNMF